MIDNEIHRSAMTDKELTQAAMRAYGEAPAGFSPLTDDGDAFRLLVALGMRDGLGTSLHLADRDDLTVVIHQALTHMTFEVDGDVLAATRRAIVRAAAAIGGKDD